MEPAHWVNGQRSLGSSSLLHAFRVEQAEKKGREGLVLAER